MSAAVAHEAAAEQMAAENDDIPDRDEAKDWSPEERSWYRRF
jgi:hypothetical protein